MTKMNFRRLANETGGMLPAALYERYYEVSRDVAKGSIVELGTGQGAGTIAFALGIRDSGRDAKVVAVDQFFQHAATRPHPASLRTHGDRAVATNVESFRNNLRRYGVEELVDIHVGRTDEVRIDFDGLLFDVLAIDVDGMVDRDLAIFYDSLAAGGMIIIDDYRDMVNNHGQKNLARFRHSSRQVIVDALEAMSSYDRRRLLGKHLLTYRLVELFEKSGLIEKVDLMGSTLFCRKVPGCRFDKAVNPADISEIERLIVDDFTALIEKEWKWTSLVKRCLRRARHFVSVIARAAGIR